MTIDTAEHNSRLDEALAKAQQTIFLQNEQLAAYKRVAEAARKYLDSDHTYDRIDLASALAALDEHERGEG